MPGIDGEYDLFVSYAHRDNHDGWVEAFVAAVEAEHARYTPAKLNIFLDLQGIRSMDDWEHRILSALRSSKLMLALLSPHFFDSAYCRKEWEIYVEHERDRAMLGESIASVYTATTPGYEDEAKAALDHWLSNMPPPAARGPARVADGRPRRPAAGGRAEGWSLLDQRGPSGPGPGADAAHLTGDHPSSGTRNVSVHATAPRQGSPSSRSMAPCEPVLPPTPGRNPGPRQEAGRCPRGTRRRSPCGAGSPRTGRG